jgi:hypothetical protein
MDLISTSAAQYATTSPAEMTATKRMLSSLYTKFNEHRDELGYPVGSNTTPYFYCSNDLCNKFGSCLELLNDAKIEIDLVWYVELLKDFAGSFDDEHPGGCCALWHSMSKEEVVSLCDNLIAKLEGRQV